MIVKRSCHKDQDLLAVELNVTEGEYLVYEVSFQGAQGVFSIVDQHGTIILSPASGPVAPGQYQKKWPANMSEVKIPDDLNHTLGIHFIGAVKYTYKATQYNKADQQISVCKNCEYESNTPTDSYFAHLRILTC